jgi:hypothetical protein
MKFLVAILLALSMFGCQTEKEEVERVKLTQVELHYVTANGNENIIFYFDTENSVCYTYVGGGRSPWVLQPVDFATCGNLFVRYILPTLNAPEQEE